MKYHWLEVENFRPFYGSSRVDFSTDPNRPVTVIFGANGGGKTSLITAMYWCLYNSTKVDPNTPDDEERLFNVRARSEVPNGGSRKLAVTLELQREDAIWRITRSLVLSKDASGNETFTPNLKLQEIIDDVPTTHRQSVPFLINQLLDKKLGEFFFHAAETLQFPFDSTRSSRDRLRDCLYKVVGQGTLDAVVIQAGNAADKLRGERATVAARVAAHSEHEAEVTRVDGEIQGYNADISEKQGELDALEPVLQRMLGTLARVELFAPKVQALTDAEGALTLARERLGDARKDQISVTRDLWKVQAQPLMASFYEWFKPRVGEFPRIVNQNLILHMETTGKCICGHDVGAEELAVVKAMAAEGDDEGARRLTQLYDWSRDWEEEAAAVKVGFEKVLGRVAGGETDVKAAEEDLTDAQDAVEEMGALPVQNAADLRQNVANKSREKTEMQTLIREWTTKKERLGRQRADLMRRNIAGAPEELQAADAEVLAAEMVEGLASSCRDIHAALCRPELEKQMNENYWVFRADRKVRIDENWEVTTYNEEPNEGDGEEFEVGGGGAETTLLTYAFAAATAKLIPAFNAVKLNEVPGEEELQAVETIPLVVDAPFSSLGTNYQRRVAEKLPRAVNQLILFNEATHLTHFKSMVESGLVGHVLSVKYVGPLENLPGEELLTTFEFAGQEITYLEDAPEQMGSEIQAYGMTH